MNYRLIEDGIYSYIEKVNAPVNSWDTFKTFSEAKKALVEKCKSNLSEWQAALKSARSTTKANVLQRV